MSGLKGGTHSAITMIADDPSEADPPFPPVGSLIEAVLLGYTELSAEPRLSTVASEGNGPESCSGFPTPTVSVSSVFIRQTPMGRAKS